MRLLTSALASASLIAAPVAGQSLTLGNLKGPIARASGKAPAKTIKDLWSQINGLPAKVGDIEPPELGADFTTVPAIVPTKESRAALIQPAPLPRSAAPDTVGAFRFICAAGHISRDDPIVYPGQPGKSHLHQWFGNTLADAHSTYASLRATGESTCMNVLNRSAYWMPAMLDGKGNVVRPDYVSIYYKRLPSSSPECQRTGKACVNLPRGLRFILGYDMVSGTPSTGDAYFNCDGPTATPGHYATITEAAANCPAGNRLGAVITAPACWDGKRLDSTNHRDHVGYISYGWWGYPKCDDAHPYIIPTFTMGAWYTVGADGAGGWYLSSDDMPGMARMPAGSTFHADWLGAWDDETLAIAEANCIDKLLNCSAGDLGNGTMLKQVWPSSDRTRPRLVPVPKREVQ